MRQDGFWAVGDTLAGRGQGDEGPALAARSGHRGKLGSPLSSSQRWERPPVLVLLP